MRFAWVSSAVVFAALSLVAGGWSAAAFHGYKSDQTLSTWLAAGYVTSEKDWARLYQENLRWETLSPFDPRHLLNRVRLLEWRASIQRLYPKYARENLRDALSGYRELNRMVPASGFVWASIGELKARLGEYDAEAVRALEVANRFDPWENLTLRRTIQTGIGHWEHWPESTRQLVRDAVSRAFLIDTTLQAEPIDLFVVNTALRYGWDEELSSLVPDGFIREYFEARRQPL